MKNTILLSRTATRIITMLHRIRVSTITLLAPILSTSHPKKIEKIIVGICPNIKSSTISCNESLRVLLPYTAAKTASIEKALLKRK
jgi:hypothetical protein